MGRGRQTKTESTLPRRVLFLLHRPSPSSVDVSPPPLDVSSPPTTPRVRRGSDGALDSRTSDADLSPICGSVLGVSIHGYSGPVDSFRSVPLSRRQTEGYRSRRVVGVQVSQCVGGRSGHLLSEAGVRHVDPIRPGTERSVHCRPGRWSRTLTVGTDYGTSRPLDRGSRYWRLQTSQNAIDGTLVPRCRDETSPESRTRLDRPPGGSKVTSSSTTPRDPRHQDPPLNLSEVQTLPRTFSVAETRDSTGRRTS